MHLSVVIPLYNEEKNIKPLTCDIISILDNINIIVERNSSTAIVGESGSGNITFVDIFFSTYDLNHRSSIALQRFVYIKRFSPESIYQLMNTGTDMPN